MSHFANMMEDMYYAHSQNYYNRLWMLEEIMGLSSSMENVEEQVVQYEDLLRRYGARTDLSREALKRIAKKENRAIIEDGNLLHLGNCTQIEETLQSSPNLSLTISVEEMRKKLGIGRTRAYELIKQPGFPKIKVGRKYLIYCAEMNKWLENKCKKDDGGMI